MPERDLALLTEAARLAAEIALRHWRRSPKVWEKPDGQGPVSEADLEVNAALEQHLRAARPDYGWLSEESPDDAARLSTRAQFILDPIDGTRSFLEGQPAFAHALAVAEGGRITAAVVFLPAQDKLYAATASGPATLNGQPIRPRPLAHPAHILTAKSTLAPEHWPGGVPDAERHFRASLAWRLCLVADGSFDAMLTFRPSWEWDIAAGSLIASRARATVTDRLGHPLRFNTASAKANGVAVATPSYHAELIARLTP